VARRALSVTDCSQYCRHIRVRPFVCPRARTRPSYACIAWLLVGIGIIFLPAYTVLFVPGDDEKNSRPFEFLRVFLVRTSSLSGRVS